MKKKSVMKVQMNCDKCRKKALQIAAGTEDVISVTNDAKDKELIAVVGISVDTIYISLVDELRKKVGHTELISIIEVKDPEKVVKPSEYHYWGPEYHYWGAPPTGFHPYPQQLVGYTTDYDENTSNCSIM